MKLFPTHCIPFIGSWLSAAFDGANAPQREQAESALFIKEAVRRGE